MVGRLEFWPIECDARASHIRGHGKVVLHDQGPRCVLVDGKRMDLDPACVFLASNKAHVELLHPMAANGNACLFRKCRNLQEACDPAAIGCVGLNKA